MVNLPVAMVGKEWMGQAHGVFVERRFNLKVFPNG